MNEIYKDYSRAVRDELDGIRDREVETKATEDKPKKGLTFYQKLMITLTLLSKKPSK